MPNILSSGPARAAALWRRVWRNWATLFCFSKPGVTPRNFRAATPLHPDQNTLPEDYEVPAFHPNSTENSALKWDFFVRHYADLEQQKRDEKYREFHEGDKVDGVFYPRAGTLGGCTAHNAMILVYPHNEDWQQIADATGDSSWAPDQMRKYFEKMENCHHRPLDRWLHAITRLNPTKHGFGGWLSTEQALPLQTILHDRDLVAAFRKGIDVAFKEAHDDGEVIGQALETQLDPNDWRVADAQGWGVHYTPLTTQ